MYNLVKRQAEVEILPMAEANGIGVIPYSPAGGGPAVGQVFRPGRRAGCSTNKMYEARYGDQWMFEVAEKYVGFCKQKGLHPVSTAIAWVGRIRRSPRRSSARAISTSSRIRWPSVEVDDDTGAARRDRRALAHAAAGHRPIGRAEDREGLEKELPRKHSRSQRSRRNADRSAGESM